MGTHENLKVAIRDVRPTAKGFVFCWTSVERGGDAERLIRHIRHGEAYDETNKLGDRTHLMKLVRGSVGPGHDRRGGKGKVVVKGGKTIPTDSTRGGGV